MPQIIPKKSSVLAVFTDFMRYLEARREIEELSEKHGLTVADMPMAIQAMTNESEVLAAVRPRRLDIITGEYHGQREGERSYEAWHSVGSLATQKGLEYSLNFRRGNDLFMTIDAKEWISVGEGNYLGEEIARVHLDDLKRGNVPKAGTPYTVFVRLDKDNPTINNSGQLSYDTFMKDDRILMLMGSPENREEFVKILFGAENDDAKGRSSIGSYHKMDKVGFEETGRGRLVSLYLKEGGGLLGYDLVDGDGRFLAVSDGIIAIETREKQSFSEHQKESVLSEPASQTMVQPTLEQTLAVINNPDLDRVGMVRAVSELYKQ